MPAAAVLVAGGESSEFSGGDPVVGFCPEVLSRTPLDLEREDVAVWVALVAGQHEAPLRWRRDIPSDSIRGFDESTVLSLDVTSIAAEDVVCGNGGYGGYEVADLEGRHLRRFELAIEFSTADGAVHGSFQQLFFPDSEGKRSVTGWTVLPFGEVAGTLELGVDPELDTATQTLNVDIAFDEQSVQGTLAGWLSGPDPALGYDTSWSVVTGVFPAPD